MKTKYLVPILLVMMLLTSLASRAEVPESGNYYLYCETTGQFLSRGGADGVHAVMDELGVPFTLSTPESGARRFLFLDNSLYLYETESGLATDGSSYRNLALTEVGEGTFTLKSYYKRVYPDVDAWLSISGNEVVLTTNEEDAAVWTLKTGAEQQAIVAQKATERIQAVAALGGLSVESESQLVEILSGYTAEDATSQIPNAALTADNSYWTLELHGATSALNWGKYTIASNNHGAMTLSQTVNGLKKGFYKVTIQAFYRGCKVAPSMTAGNAGFTMTNATFTANSNYTPIVDWYTIRDSDTKPDSRGDITDFTQAKYTNTVYTYVGSDGVLTLVIDNPSYFNSSGAWFNFNNITLTYYDDGQGEEELNIEPALAEIDRYATFNTASDDTYSADLETLRGQVLAAETNEQIDELMATLPQLYLAYVARLTPTDTPYDITPMIRNPRFDNYDTDWTIDITNPAGYTKTHKFCTTATPHVLEAYSGYSNFELSGFDVHQTITLPAGMYRIKVQSFYRYGLTYNTDLSDLGTGVSRSYLYAGDESKKIMRLGDLTLDSYANDLEGASAVIGEGLYGNALVFTLDAETTFDVGVRGTFEEMRSWSIVGPFTLEKISQSILDAEEAEQLNDLQKQYAELINVLANITKPSPGYSEFAPVVAAAKAQLAETTDETAMQGIVAEMRTEVLNFISTHDATDVHYDLTPLLVNPGFDAGTEGWQTRGMNAVDGGILESFNSKTSNLYQTLSGMPAGTYQLKVQAFHRFTDWVWTIHPHEMGEETVTAYLSFDGQKSAPIASIHDAARFVPSNASGSVEGAFNRSIPNTAMAASAAFKDGLYWNVMTVEKTDAGDLTIGLELEGGLTNNWVALDNFQLHYGRPSESVEVACEGDGLTLTSDAPNAQFSTDLMLKASQYNMVCLPVTVPASAFSEAYRLAGVSADGADVKGTLVPMPSNADLRAGEVYFVKPNADGYFSLDNTSLTVAQPDRIPVMWEGGYTTGYFTPQPAKGGFTIDENGRLTKILADTPVPAFTGLFYPSEEMSGVDEISLEIADWNNMDITVDLENQRARDYLANTTYTSSSDASTIASYAVANPPARLDHPHTVIVPLPECGDGITLEYTPQGTEDTESIVVANNATVCEIPNLIPGVDYTYNILSGGSTLSSGTIHATGHLRMIKAVTGNNIRDLGGWVYNTESGGRVKYGKLYRGGEMNGDHQVDEYDRILLRDLGIKAEMDIREDVDITDYVITESALGSDIDYIYLNQHGHSSTTVATDSLTLGKAFMFMLNNLRRGYPVYYHCYWGADRTAMYTMLYLGVLGVDLGDIYKDYELTTFSNAGSRVKSDLNSKVDYIQSLEGNNYQERCYTYWTKVVGLSTQDVDEFIRIMTDEDYEPELTDIPVGGYYYLYDANAGLFLSRGGDNGVTAVLDELGSAVEISAPTTGTRSFRFLDNALYLAENAEGITTDASDPSAWTVSETDADNFTVSITNSLSFPDTEAYLSLEGNKVVLSTDDTEHLWQLVSPERHNDIVAQKKDERIQAMAAQGGLTVANENELIQYLATVKMVDMTSSIPNAELTANSDNWTLELLGPTSALNWGRYTIGSNNFGAMTLSQTVGDLPSGFYKVTIQAFQRESDVQTSMKYGNKGITMANATFSANDNFTPIVDWYTIRDSETKPNSRGDITDFTQAKYTNTVYTYVGEDGQLRLQFQNPSYYASSGSWTNLNNVTLTYFDSESALQPGDDLTPAITNAACAGLEGWHISDGANGALQVDTWSSSGSKDGTGMTTPFIEYWISSSSTLADANVYHDQVANLQPGTYRLTVLVRLCSESGATTIADASMYANGVTLDLTTGTPYTYGSRNGIYGTYDLEFEVGEDGTLDFGFTVENATFNWLAFKNIKLTYVAAPDTPVAIDTLAADATPAGIYTITGIRLTDHSTRLPKGLYIINGKKVLVK